MPFYYRVHGFKLASEFELPDLAQREDPGHDPDVWVRRAQLPHFPEAKPTSLSYLSAVAAGALFTIEGVGRYLVRSGKEIIVDLDPEADVALARAYLFATVMAMICAQRNLLALHASAVAFKDHAVAFAGETGAGKSTIAARCLAGGGKLMCDDLLVVSLDAGRPIAQPGMPNIKLWRDALANLGRTSDGLRPDWFRAEKFHVPVESSSSPLPLTHLYILARDQDAGVASCRPLTGASAISAIVKNTYKIEHIEFVGNRELHFQQCAKLARSIEIMELRRNQTPENFFTAPVSGFADITALG